jgi:methylmalonyl-CoA mutase cobalamin-binding subunit
MDAPAIGAMTAGLPARVGSAGPSTGASADHLAQAFVASAAALDEPGFEAVLDEMFARGSFEQVASDLVMPALVALGEGWERGRLDVAGEHTAAGAVQRRLGMAFMAAGRPSDDAAPVLVGLPPSARHDLGALAFATCLRRAGIGVRYMGADLPVEDWLQAVQRTSARGVVIGSVIADDVDPARQVALAIRAAHPDLLLAFGGRSADKVDISALGPALILPDDLSQAVEALRLNLASARASNAIDRP